MFFTEKETKAYLSSVMYQLNTEVGAGFELDFFMT